MRINDRLVRLETRKRVKRKHLVCFQSFIRVPAEDPATAEYLFDGQKVKWTRRDDESPQEFRDRVEADVLAIPGNNLNLHRIILLPKGIE